MKLAIDLGGTHLRLGAGDGRGPWAKATTVRRTEAMTPDDLTGLIGATLEGWEIDSGDIEGVGISVAALVDDTGRILRAENLGWSDVPLAAIVAGAVGRPARVDSDVFCGALYEMRVGHARAASSALYIAVGTGVGHAFVIGGRVWRGAQGRANAMGHMVLWPDGAPCYCGGRGCLCGIASGRAQAVDRPPPGALDALAQAIGIALTLVEPALVILSGGALDQRWCDLEELERRIPSFIYPGIVCPPILRSDVPDSSLRGAALMVGDAA